MTRVGTAPAGPEDSPLTEGLSLSVPATCEQSTEAGQSRDAVHCPSQPPLSCWENQLNIPRYPDRGRSGQSPDISHPTRRPCPARWHPVPLMRFCGSGILLSDAAAPAARVQRGETLSPRGASNRVKGAPFSGASVLLPRARHPNPTDRRELIGAEIHPGASKLRP